MVLSARQAFLRSRGPWILAVSPNLDCPSPLAPLAGVNPPGGSLQLRNLAMVSTPILGISCGLKAKRGWWSTAVGLRGKKAQIPRSQSNSLRATDVGRGSPPDRCVHERRTGDTKTTITEHHNRNIMVI